MNRIAIILLGIVVGLAFLYLGFLYIKTPAGSLPTWLPGFEAGSNHIHLKHAIAAFVLGLGSLILAWFKSGKRSP